MILYLVTLAVVWCGFLIGGWYGGNPGSFVGGTSAMLLCLVLTDVFLYDRQLDGFLPRHRGTMTSFFVIIVSIILGIHFFGATWGPLLGIVAGEFLGRWLNEALRWGGKPVQQDHSFRVHCLLCPVALASIDSDTDPEELKTLHKIATRWLLPIGLHHDQVRHKFLNAAKSVMHDPESIQHLREMPQDFRSQFLLDSLAVAYSRKVISPEKMQALLSLEIHLALPDRSCRERYDRQATLDRLRSPALQALGLSPDATQTQIDLTYRRAVRQYHPDRVQGAPEHLSELAREKIAILNQAHQILKSADVTSWRYLFRGYPAEEHLEPDGRSGFSCRCWLCDQANRIPENVHLHSVRCGNCHALLGTALEA